MERVHAEKELTVMWKYAEVCVFPVVYLGRSFYGNDVTSFLASL